MSEVELLQRKLHREQLARLEAEQLLEQKSLDLYQSQQQLIFSEKLAAIGQLAAGVAHEINNPVGFVSSNLDSLREYLDDLVAYIELQQKVVASFREGRDAALLLQQLEQLQESIGLEFLLSDSKNLLQTCAEGTERVKRIVADLSEYSHVKTDEWQMAHVEDLLEKSINIATNELKYKAELVRDIGETPAIYCDAGKLEQVFLNLLVNAAQSIKDQGRVFVRTWADWESNLLKIEIEDTGCGIARKDMEKIFDPFYTSKPVGQGTGLGLHVVQGVIDAHRGKIVVRSVVGKGSCFAISLPLNARATGGRS